MKFSEVAIGQMFTIDGQKCLRVKEHCNRLNDEFCNSQNDDWFLFVEDDAEVELITACVNCKHYYLYDDNWCSEVQNKIDDIDQDPKTFSCSHFTEKDK